MVISFAYNLNIQQNADMDHSTDWMFCEVIEFLKPGKCLSGVRGVKYRFFYSVQIMTQVWTFRGQ